jgi:hypothetical protein
VFFEVAQRTAISADRWLLRAVHLPRAKKKPEQ